MNAPNVTRSQRDLLPKSVELLSEISRDPGVYGDEIAALALGSLAYFATPDQVVPPDAVIKRPSGTLVALAVLSQLSPEQTSGLGAPELFRYARKEALPFVEAARDRLVRAGQSIVVGIILDKATKEIPKATRDLEPVLEMLRNAPRVIAEDPPPDFGKTLVGNTPIPKRALLEPNEYHIGETDPALSRDDRHFLKGMHINPKYSVTFEELTSPWMLRDDYFHSLVEWVDGLRRTTSPNLARVHGLLKKDSRVFVVYDVLEGNSFDQLVSQGPMEEGEVIGHLEKLLEGLRAMHKEKQVFKGLRPDRILLDRNGNLMLFSYPPPKVKSLSNKGDEETLREKGLKGEVRYLAPEICLGTETPGAAADIYSAALIACEMMLGEQNLQQIAGEHVKFWLNWHVDLYKKAVPLSDIDPAISEDFTAVISKMLEKRMKNRYQEASEVLEDIRSIKTGRRLPGNRKTSQRKGPAAQTGISTKVGGEAEKQTKARQALIAVGFAMVAFMMTTIVIKVLQPEATDPVVEVEKDPASSKLEEALLAFRAEDFDKAQNILDEVAKYKLNPQMDEAVQSTKKALKEAREFKGAYNEAVEQGKKLEGAGQNDKAIESFQKAAEAYKKISIKIEKPDRPLPPEIRDKIDVMEPKVLIENSKAYLCEGQFELAKKKTQLCLNNFPTSPVTPEAEELLRKINTAIAKKSIYEECYQKAKGLQTSGRNLDAAAEYFKARQAWIDVAELSCTEESKVASRKQVPPELLDGLNSVYTSLWSIQKPEQEQTVTAEEFILELDVPEKYFEKVSFLGKTVPVKSDYLTIKIPDFKEGSHTMEIAAYSRDGYESRQKVTFTFKLPASILPDIQLYSIATVAGRTLAEIGYSEERYSVEKGWTSPDEIFTVSEITEKAIEIVTKKGRKMKIPL